MINLNPIVSISLVLIIALIFIVSIKKELK